MAGSSSSEANAIKLGSNVFARWVSMGRLPCEHKRLLLIEGKYEKVGSLRSEILEVMSKEGSDDTEHDEDVEQRDAEEEDESFGVLLGLLSVFRRETNNDGNCEKNGYIFWTFFSRLKMRQGLMFSELCDLDLHNGKTAWEPVYSFCPGDGVKRNMFKL